MSDIIVRSETFQATLVAHLRHLQNYSIATNCNAMYVKKLEFWFFYFQRRTNRSRDIAFLLNK